jgi:hypothetical protein
MNYTTDRQRADNKITASGAAAVKALAAEIGQLLQVSNAYVTASTCSGKWRGSFDYSLSYDGGSIFFANIGNHRNNSDITRRIIENLEELRNKYALVFRKSTAILEALKSREIIDNSRALENGFKTYTVKRIGIVTAGHNYTGWAYLILDVDGSEQFFIETGLKFDIFSASVDKLATAEALSSYNKDTHDYIFNGCSRALDDWKLPEGVTVISQGVA